MMSFMDLSNIFNIDENGSEDSFSFSLSSPTDATPKEVNGSIGESLQRVLDSNFGGEKSKIVQYPGRLNFACPYCGDSHNDTWKKRGNIYLKNYMFKCFNCGKVAGVNRFFKDHSVELSAAHINYIISNQDTFSVNDKAIDPYFLHDKEGLIKIAIDRKTIEEKYGLVLIDKSKIFVWLNKRLQPEFTKFSWSEKKQQLFIFHIIPGTSKVLGFQIRNFVSQPKYMTFKLSKIYEQLGFEVPQDMTEIDKISTSFGILELSLNKPITVFEGPLDSFMYRNSSATCGDKNDFPLEAENVRFFYDYDEAGRKSSLKKMEEGKQVFLWKKFLQDAKIPQSTHKMDLSDVLVYAKRKGIVLPKFNEYFSDSKYDAYWI